MRTRVGIVGAGPAGLLLSHLLHLEGIDSIVVEARSREHVEQRIRAGVLEQGTVDVLNAAGLGERMRAQGLVHRGINLRFGGKTQRIDFAALTGGKAVTVYGQHEVVKDLIAARLAAGGELHFEAAALGLRDVESDRPRVLIRDGAGVEREIVCDFIAGCDGFHGVCRPSVASALTVDERVFPFAWLGILAESPPVSEELIYTHHARGFALMSMRSPAISRLYLQCSPDDELGAWPDARIWDELGRRLAGADAPRPRAGAVVQKSITAMRAFVAAPLRHGRLFLAGDAAHIVPPTGAKGMNLAVADVRLLARALAEYYAAGSSAALGAYSDACLRRVWKTQRFSAWMTALLHTYPDGDRFTERLQRAELEYVTSSRAAATALAENYVGLPFD